MKNRYVEAYCERKAGAPAGQPGEPIRFVASSPGIKRDGVDLVQENWDLENYRKNPVFLWVHDYFGRNLPLGRAETLLEAGNLMADVTFDQADDFARQVEGKYRNGFLNAVSVGWNDHAYCVACGAELDRWSMYGLDYLRKKCPACERELTEDGIKVQYELLDISAVPVPGDPDALMEREFRALKAVFEPAGARAEDEGEWGKLAAEMVAVFAPAPDENDGERFQRYQRLAVRYRRLGKTPPEFLDGETLRVLGDREWTGLFLEGEVTTPDEPFLKARKGAVLNTRNRGDLEQAVTLIQGVLERAKAEDEAPAAEAAEEAEAVRLMFELNNIREALVKAGA